MITEADFFIEDTEAIRAELVESLVRIDALRAQKRELEADLADLTDRVKAWLEEHPGEVLVDLERGITAELREKNKAPDYDLIRMAEKHPDLVVEAAKLGLLSARTTAIRQQRGRAAAADALLDRFAMPGGVSTELRVERQR